MYLMPHLVMVSERSTPTTLHVELRLQKPSFRVFRAVRLDHEDGLRAVRHVDDDGEFDWVHFSDSSEKNPTKKRRFCTAPCAIALTILTNVLTKKVKTYSINNSFAL